MFWLILLVTNNIEFLTDKIQPVDLFVYGEESKQKISGQQTQGDQILSHHP